MLPKIIEKLFARFDGSRDIENRLVINHHVLDIAVAAMADGIAQKRNHGSRNTSTVCLLTDFIGR